MKVKNYLLGYKNLYIYQDNEMFNFSLDSVLLPNFVTLNKKITKIMDIGCGNAPIPLILSTKTDAKIIGVEIQKDVAALALESVELNKLQDKIEIINGDIKEVYKNYDTDTFDVITCNPPFFKNSKNLNDSNYKTLARHEVSLSLEDIIVISKKLLKNNGALGIVHRPERLIEIIEIMRKNNIEPKRIQYVYPNGYKEANILLIEGRKNGRPGLKVLEPIFAHKENGDYTDQVKKFFE